MEWTRDSRITYYVLFSKLTQDKPVFVQASVGAGFGLFAAKDFKVGELVLAEEPFVVLPSKATSEEQVEKELTKIIENLDETKRVLFWSFSDKHIPKASNSKRTVKGIVETNGLPMGDRIRDRIPSKAGMYQFLCRLNHSCRPNVHHQWNSLLKRQTIYAIRSIKAGEELFTAYFDCSGLTSQQRQCLTLAKWNFVCKCVKCTQTNALLIQSDKKQTEIAALDEAIPLMAMLNTRKALELVKERIKLMKEEDSYDFTELVRSEYDAYQICVNDHQCEHIKEASNWIKRAYLHSVVSRGLMCEQSMKLRDICLGAYFELDSLKRLWTLDSARFIDRVERKFKPLQP